MKFIRNYFKSKRRDAIAREFVALLWQHDLKSCDNAGPKTNENLTRMINHLGRVAYRIADALEESRNRKTV